MNYGFVKPKIDDTHYRTFGGFAGSIPKVILQANGDWTPYLPEYERQFGDGFDTYGCTVFGTLNVVETIFKKVFGGDYDFSERYIYNIAEVLPPGHDPHDIAEKIRKFGVIDQKELPMKDTLEEFASPRPMTKDLIDKGHLWLAKYDFKHEWVFSDLKDLSKRHQYIREWLKSSPLGVSVTAWNKDENGEYESKGQDNTHWCMAFRIDVKDRIYVFDSYDQEIKVLSPTHDIQFCKRYCIMEKTPSEQLNNARLNLISIIWKYVSLLLSKSSKLAGEFIQQIYSTKN